MLKTYFKRPPTLAKYYAGPAGPYFDDFIQWLEKQGYQFPTIRRRLHGAARIASWATTAGFALQDLDSTALKAFGRYLARRGQLRYPGGNRTHCYLGAQLFLSFLKARGIVSAPANAAPSAAPFSLLSEFQQWMRTQRGVTESTLSNYHPILLDLLESLSDQADRFTAKNLRQFVLNRARRHGKGRAKTVVTAVRMFVRFLIASGHCKPGLDEAIPTIAQWRLSSLPRYLPPEAIERIIAACDTTTPLGLRDRAIILLMAHLGLRAGDVAGLKLTDVNWQEGTLVVMGKNRRQTRLPLSQEVGNVLWDYLERTRPPVGSESVFISVVAPWVALSRQAIGHIAARAIKRVGIDAPFLGAHLFRHSAATDLLRQGASLQAIGEVLRHASVETTAHYCAQ